MCAHTHMHEKSRAVVCGGKAQPTDTTEGLRMQNDPQKAGGERRARRMQCEP